eukprot:1841941-Pleurochrysis_carterae.AAC.1
MTCATSVDDREESRNARMLAASRIKSVLTNQGGAAPSAEEGGGSKPLDIEDALALRPPLLFARALDARRI